MVLVEEPMGKRAQKRVSVVALSELFGYLAKCGRSNACDGLGIHIWYESRMESAVIQIDIRFQAAADEFASGVFAEPRKLVSKDIFQGRIVSFSEQRVFLRAVELLEVRFGAHGTFFRIEAGLRDQAYGRVRFRVLGAGASLMCGNSCFDIGGVSRVKAAVPAFQNVDVVFERFHDGLDTSKTLVRCVLVAYRQNEDAPSFLCRNIYHVRDASARNCATVGTWAFKPPSTVTTCPVKYSLSSDARYTHMAAISSGEP